MSKKGKVGGGARSATVITSSSRRVNVVKNRRITAQKAREEKNKTLRSLGEVTPSDRWREVKERATAARERRRMERRDSVWRQTVGYVKGPTLKQRAKSAAMTSGVTVTITDEHRDR